VGLVSGISFASLGHEIIFVDVDEEKIGLINNSKPPIYEKGLKELMKDTCDNYFATRDYRKAVQGSDLTFICVGTPSKSDGSIDSRYVKQASARLGEVLAGKEGKHFVVVKSTVLPGTTESIVKPLLEKFLDKKGFNDFGLAMNPEFLREGVALDDFLNPDRIVLGVDDTDTRDKLLELYRDIDSKKLVTSIKEAEMIKYVSNAFLATKISFANEIGNICKRIGVDSWKIFEGVGMDSRISPSFFRSGIGYGGSCFPKDVKALQNYANSLEESTAILDAVETVNAYQPLKLVELLRKHVTDISEKKIGVLGLAFKPGTEDIRESRAILIIDALKEETNLYLHDPIAMDNFKEIYPDLNYVDSANMLVDLCDVVLITTEWPEFEELDYSGKYVFDGRRIKAAEIADIYEGICW
jgi:UDPglucose 6-dehydrogenase